MTDLEFNEGNTIKPSFQSRAAFTQPQEAGMVGFLMKRGIVKTANQAYGVLITIAVLCIIAAIALPIMFGTGGAPVTPDLESPIQVQ